MDGAHIMVWFGPSAPRDPSNLWESSLVYILALALVGNVRAGTTVPDKVQHPVPARASSHGEGVGWKE